MGNPSEEKRTRINNLRGLAILYHPPFWNFGGSERRFVEISKHLKRFGISFDAIESYSPINSLVKEEDMKKGTYYVSYVIRLPENLFLSLIGWLLLGVGKILTLRKMNYDFVYVINNNLYNLLLGFLASKMLCIPSIAVVHHLRWVDYTDLDAKISFNLKKTFYFMRKMGLGILPSLFRTVGSYIENYLLKKTDVCITVSNTVASQLRQMGCKNVIVSGNGLKDLKYETFYQKAKELNVIYVGRFDEGKGLFDILRVWRMVEEKLPKAKLLLVGKGYLYDKVKTVAKKWNLSSIQFLGCLKDEEVNSLMASSKVFLTLSTMEGFGLAIGEALAHNLSVVCYDIPTLREIYGDCPYVRFIKIGKIEEVASEVINLLKEDFMSQIGFSEPRDFIKRFSWLEVAQKEYSTIKAILSGKTVKKNFLFRKRDYFCHRH
jgi:glycosyltransferase involved in cell wall biosynthesis